MAKKITGQGEIEQIEKTIKRQLIKQFFNGPDLIGSKTRIEFICLFIINWAVALMLLTPLIVSGRFFFPFVAPKGLYLMGLVEIAFFSWLILAIYSSRYRPKKNILLLCLGSFLVVLTLATIFGVDPSRSFWSKFERMSGLLMWLHLFALFLVLTNIFKSKRAWVRLFTVSVGVAILTCVFFFIDKFGVEELPVAKGGSTLGNSSFFATYLLFNLYFAIYLLSGLWSKRKENTLGLSLLMPATILMAITLVMSNGVAAILAFFGGLGLIASLWLAFETKKNGLRKIGRILLIFSIIIFLTSVVLLCIPNSIVQQKLVDARNKARPLLWQMAGKGFLERPILGWGPQNFSFVFNKNFDPCFYLSECGGETRFDQPHNIIFNNLTDAGILGLLTYLSISISSFYLLWKSYFKKRIVFWTAAIPTAILVAHFTQNLTVFDMPASFLMLFLTLGFVSTMTQKGNRKLKESRNNKRLVGPALIIVGILFVFCFSNFVINPARANVGALQAMGAKKAESRISFYEQTFYSSPMGRYQLRNYIGLHILKLVSSKKEVSKYDLDILIQELEKSIDYSPLDYYSHLTLGKLYNLYGKSDSRKLLEGEKVLEKAVEISPTKQAAYWELTITKILLGKNEEWIVLAEKAVELEPRVAHSHIYLVNFAIATENRDLAVRKAKEAIEIFPDLEPQFKQMLGIEEW